MEQPKYILPSGTKIRTNAKLDDTDGMFIAPKHLSARQPNKEGVLGHPVPGHGGDVYWASHEGSEVAAAYCFTEFELNEIPPQNLSQVVD